MTRSEMSHHHHHYHHFHYPPHYSSRAGAGGAGWKVRMLCGMMATLIPWFATAFIVEGPRVTKNLSTMKTVVGTTTLPNTLSTTTTTTTSTTKIYQGAKNTEQQHSSLERQETEQTQETTMKKSVATNSHTKKTDDVIFQQTPLATQTQQQQQQTMVDPFQADFRDSSEPQLPSIPTTLSGGTSLMFEMIAKRMLNWGNEAEAYDGMEDEKDTVNPNPLIKPTVPSSNFSSVSTTSATPATPATTAASIDASEALPRWHPHSGIADSNPNFRKQPPAMSNQGFSKAIWRNVRKRNKPSLWKYALRTYDRMTVLEQDPTFRNIQRSNSHHEGAMLACAKLGLWQRALEIYHHVHQVEQDAQAEFDRKQAEFNQQQQKLLIPKPSSSLSSSSSSSSSQSLATKTRPRQQDADIRRSRIRRSVHVTDTMITALVQACVVASRKRQRNNRLSESDQALSPLLQEEQEAALRRIPLDTALEILSTMPETHCIPLVARHLNPLATAYQSLGYIPLAREILDTLLSNRTAGEEPEDGIDILNVYDLCAKDKGSYSLLVQGAVVAGDWGSAVDALSDMTNAGLYPKARHCNLWSEISERRIRPRAVGSRKKKRDDLWAESVM